LIVEGKGKKKTATKINKREKQ